VNFVLRTLVPFGLLAFVILPPKSFAQMDGQTPAPSLTRSEFAPVPLRAPERSKSLDTSGDSAKPISRSSTAPLITVGSSLAIVLGLFAALVWVSRKTSKNNPTNRDVPDEVMKVLGKRTIGHGNSIALVRCGRSLLIVGIHSTGMQRLGEITSDEEVRHLEALCSGQSKASFNETLIEMQREPIKRGFVGEGIERPRSAGHKLFSVS
jgi:flagellar protein FliO/FliZ